MQKSYDDILEEQAKMLMEKNKKTQKTKRLPLIQRDQKHFDSADYEKKKQEMEKNSN